MHFCLYLYWPYRHDFYFKTASDKHFRDKRDNNGIFDVITSCSIFDKYYFSIPCVFKCICACISHRKASNRNWGNQKANPALKTKTYIYICSLQKVKSMQRSATEAIRTQLQPSKPKREETNITNSQNAKRTLWSTE